MSNWCSNTLFLGHTNPEKIREAIAAYNNGGLLSFLCPNASRPANDNDCRDDIEGWSEDDEEWNLESWGVSDGLNKTSDSTEAAEYGVVYFHFESRNLPPLRAYRAGNRLHGFSVWAHYFEPGALLGGVFTIDYNEEGESHFLPELRPKKAVPPAPNWWR